MLVQGKEDHELTGHSQCKGGLCLVPQEIREVPLEVACVWVQAQGPRNIQGGGGCGSYSPDGEYQGTSISHGGGRYGQGPLGLCTGGMVAVEVVDNMHSHSIYSPTISIRHLSALVNAVGNCAMRVHWVS